MIAKLGQPTANCWRGWLFDDGTSEMISIKNNGFQPILIIFSAYAIAMPLTAIVAILVDAPFTLWFKDTPFILLATLIFIVVLGIAWDGLLISVGLISQTWQRWSPSPENPSVTVESMRRIRFFSCGLSPLIMIVTTAFVILGTSNITLLSLKLLSTTTHWRDAFFWNIEGPIIERLTQLPIHVAAWDKLYHSAWGIELFAAFVLILVGRGPRIILHFCLSLILLFYVGRFIGLVNPVMGPAFFRPELFAYLNGSATNTAMQLVSGVMSQSPEQAMERGGVLLGGVSAMPSLHVAMVAVTSYWLAVAKHWTMYITVPWILLVWISTVVLGWHYILDGAGGIALGAACIWSVHRVLRTWV